MMTEYDNLQEPIKHYYNHIIVKFIFYIFIIYAIFILIANYQDFFGETFYQSFMIYMGVFFFFVHHAVSYLFGTALTPSQNIKVKSQIYLGSVVLILIVTELSSVANFSHYVTKTFMDLEVAYQNYEEEMVYLNEPKRLNLDNPKVRSYNLPMRTMDGKDKGGGSCEMYSFQKGESCHFRADYTKPYRHQYFVVRDKKGNLIDIWVLKLESLDGKEVIFDGRELYKIDQMHNKRYLFVYLIPLCILSLISLLLSFVPMPKFHHL